MEGSLRWEKINSSEILSKIFNRILDTKFLERTKSQNPDIEKTGRIPIMLEHPIEKLEFENAIKELESIPEYTLNQEVVNIHYKAILILADKFGSQNNDFRLTKKNFQNVDSRLMEILTSDIKNLTFNDFKEIPSLLRKVFNNNSAKKVVDLNMFSLIGNLLKISKE